MLRINRQIIFEDDEDSVKFIDTLKQKTNSNSIRMQACMYARLVTWQYGKRGKEGQALGKTKLIHTISILSFASDAPSKEGATKRERKAKPIR
jgi:predicted DNA-binding WGR domain protein